MGKIHLLSLGCAKNLVDSEKLLKKLYENGFCYTSNEDDADILMVNTCGFIEDAKRESIDEILKKAKYKAESSGKRLVVFGCLAKRFGEELKNEIPEIDAIWGVGEEDKIAAYCRTVGPASSEQENGDVFSDRAYAYLKIAEGCDRQCTYCAIPGIRGGYKSRDPREIVAEAEELLASGTKELIVIAQDITSYGKDTGGHDLSSLVREIASIDGDFWVRLLYLYPTSIDQQLIETIASVEKICKYIDMPLQHSEEKVLKLMGRGGSADYYERLISRLRSSIPGVVIRTTFIVGFPKETDQDFEGMAGFVRRMRFDRLGVFKYSREEDTAAFRIKGQVPKKVKDERYNRIMELQSVISLEKNSELVGKTFRALVDEVDEHGAVARLYSQAPEIDGVVLLSEKDVERGKFVNVRIEEALDYDLKGRIVG